MVEEKTTHRQISLDEFLSDEGWWSGSFNDTSQMPLALIQRPKDKFAAQSSLYVYDPYNKIVGHEKEKEVSKAIVLKTLKTFARIRKMRSELKKRGLKEDSPPGNCIVDILREKFPTMPMIVRVGPYGGSKTLQQECEQEYLFQEREKFGLTGYDYYTRPKNGSPLGFELVEKSSPEGIIDTEKFEKRKERNAQARKSGLYAVLLGIPTFLSAVVIEILINEWALAQAFGINPELWIADGIVTVLPYTEDLAAVGILATLAYAAKRHFNKNKSKELGRLLSNGEDKVQPYIGHETLANLRGEYENDPEKAPQFRLKTLGDALRANEKVLIFENIHATSKELQQNLSQILEEKYIDVGGLSIRKFFYSLVSVGLNTEKLSQIEESLRNRLNYSARLNVRNEIARDEEAVAVDPKTETVFVRTSDSCSRTGKNERHLYLFLADRVNRMAGVPWRKEACEELADYCSRLAEDSTKLRIDRGVVNVLEETQKLAQQEGAPYVEKRHLVLAERRYRSLMQLAMKDKLSDYALQYDVEPRSGSEVGVVRILTSYQDKNLKSSENSESGTFDYTRSEDYLGCPVKISATVQRPSSMTEESSIRGYMNIVSKGKELDKTFYTSALTALFAKENINLNEYNVNLSVPALSDDDAILCGAYAAIKSAIEKKPVRQDVYVSAKLLETGELTSLPRLNSRLSLMYGSQQDVLISDFDNKLKVTRNGKSIYGDVKISSFSSLDELMERLTS